MHELLPYYERELSFLRRHGREFAERFPKIAARLSMSGEACDDPHVERLLESFALLSARIHRKLDDEFPELTETLLGVLYPHYLRPFPSCSIARIDAAGSEAQLSEAVTIPRGTILATRAVKGVSCRFRTAYEVSVAPIRVVAAGFEDPPMPGRGFRVPEGATSAITVTLEMLSEAAGIGTPRLDRLRFFLDGEPSLVSQIREALFSRLVGVLIEQDPPGSWRDIGVERVQPAGFAAEDGLLDYDARSLPAYRLLTEFFAFPEKFNFFDLNLSGLQSMTPPGTKHLHVKFLLCSSRTREAEAPLLERVGGGNFVLGCTPVVNLFQRQAEPIRVTHAKSSYPVVVDSRRAYAYELYAIRSVHKVERTTAGERVVEFRPFYALRHAEALEQHGRFWMLRQAAGIADLSPGYEYEMSIVDHDFDAEADKTETLSIAVSCTNRDLPALLPYGLPGGDLTIEGGSVARSVAFLRKPTASHRFDRRGDALWKLISHLSLNHLSLTEDGLEALKETLALYNIGRSAANQRCIDGLVRIAHRATTARVAGNPFPTFVKGMEIDLYVDEQAFVGTGLSLFASVLERFFALYVHANSFSQLVMRSAKSGEVIRKWPPRSGDIVLV